MVSLSVSLKIDDAIVAPDITRKMKFSQNFV